MGLLAPLALGFLPLLALITILYLLRLRRPETAVSSLYLWRSLLQDREANAPWQRLSASFLLLLQLAIAAALILALTRPWATAPAAGGRNVVVIMDVSASMGATDEPGGQTRLAEAVRLAWARIAALPSNGTAAVIAAGDHARVVAPAGADAATLRRALDSLRAGPTTTDLTEALGLAAGLAAVAPDPEVLIYSDGRFADPRPAVPTLAAPVHFVAVGKRGANQAVVALSLRRTADTLALSAGVLNAAGAPVTRRLDIALDGVDWAGRTLTLPAGETTQVLVPDVPLSTQVVHVHLAGADDLALDDDGWTVNRQAAPAPVLLVTGGNAFLQNALVLLPNVALERTTPADYAPMLTATLTVFDHAVPPATLPAGNLLFLAPPASTALFQVSGVLSNPVPLLNSAPAAPTPADATAAAGVDPLLRYTDLSDLHIAAAARLTPPDWARTVLDSDGGPLIVAGETEGRRVAVIAFDLHDSDLPLQMAFPLLMRNLMGYLLPDAAGGLAAGVAPGDAVPLIADLPDGVDRLTVAGPDGTILATYPVRPDSYRFQFSGTAALGVYVVTQWTGATAFRREGFAVNLFSADESRTAPRGAPPLPRTMAAQPAAGGAGAQVEWWQIAALLALLALVGEWLITHRLGLRRLGRRLLARRSGESLGNP